MSAGIVFHLLAALAYTALAISLWVPLRQMDGQVPARRWRHLGLAAALALHGAGLALASLGDGSLHLGWSLALSAAVWLGMLVFWLESLVMPIQGLLLILLPTSAATAALAALFPSTILIQTEAHWLRTHLLIALTAYGLLTVAALQAMFMAALDRQLHRPVARDARGLLDRALDAMPPLLVQEVLLFRLVWIGFTVLTLTVLTGALVSIQLTGMLFPLDHKTIFTLLSWLTFGGLLLGRSTRGWRGRLALRWTLAGFAFLLLAYTGTRFVLEVILAR